jgi:hypothetical protein
MEKELESLTLLESKEILGNITCAICIELAREPVFTECKHIFCHVCITEYIEMTPQEVELKCPMCRAVFNKSFKPKVDKDFESKIRKYHAKEYDSRMKLLEEAVLKCDFVKIKILYGNTHKLVENPKKSRTEPNTQNKHKWCMFVKTDGYDSEKVIRKVTFGLHPTFGVSEIEVKSAPFAMTKVGWGTFDIPVKIDFCAWTKLKPLELTHELKFTGNGETNVNILKLNKDVFEKNKSFLYK